VILKERKYEICSKCGQRGKIIQYEEYGCDYCNKYIGDEDKQNNDILDITIWYKEDYDSKDVKSFHFCSWVCLMAFLKKEYKKVKYMIDFPVLTARRKTKGTRIIDFLQLIKER
jgi:hypothetical protein